MKWIIPLEKVRAEDRPRVGGKAHALSRIMGSGRKVPKTLCLATDAYDDYVDRAGLRERILLNLHRKKFDDMRWEEIWDVSLRIRNLFLGKPFPDDMNEFLCETLARTFGNRPVAVRSSAPGEDSQGASFAGLHESFVNVTGIEDILKSIRLVWSSLWSDAALLYRRELKLEAEKTAMAVLIQEMISGQASGVGFGRDPNQSSRGVIEAVHGLNQGLVDGKIEPDRWFFDPKQKVVSSHTPAHRTAWATACPAGVCITELPSDLAARPPLSQAELKEVTDAIVGLGELFRRPQDVEWTFRKGALHILQSRPITTLREDDDQRVWLLSLRKSAESLADLRERIENHHIPQMIRTDTVLSSIRLRDLTDAELAGEIRRRYAENEKWVDVYWKEFIPFAHGVRLFGEFYNDAVRPEDPYEFTALLVGTEMMGIERNRMLGEMADMIRQNPGLPGAPENGTADPALGDAAKRFREKLEDFVERFGDLTCRVTGATHCTDESGAIIAFLVEMAQSPPVHAGKGAGKNTEMLKERFLSCFTGEKKAEALAILDLARASYRLRDDDNIHLGRIEAHLIAAIHEARERLAASGGDLPELSEAVALMKVEETRWTPTRSDEKTPEKLRVRQIVGQPAGPGLARGRARVIRNASDLTGFKKGEILVCDGVDPNMTFAVPLASGIVERRGGMLIHGAIIAREYGLPCVTGAPRVTEWVKTGDVVTVDGYLGIVTIGE